MTRDLIDLMHANVEARERSIAGIQPADGTLAVTARRVRRKRAVRRTLQSGGVAALAVVLGGASWFGLRGHEEPAPALTPTSSPTPSATPSPTPSATAAPVVLDEIPGLPPTQALPPGLLERTTPGWVLTIHRPEVPWDGRGLQPGPVRHTVVLVSPTGDRYRVVDLPLDRSVTVLHWDAGSTTAVVTIFGTGGLAEGSEARAELDLTTGTLTPTPVDLGEYAGGPHYVGLAADGAELWSTATSTDAYTADVYRRTDDGTLELVGGMGMLAVLDAEGKWLATDDGLDGGFAILDVVHGGRTELDFGVPGRSCDVVGWAEARSLLALCADADPEGMDYPPRRNATLYRVDVSGASTRTTELQRFPDDEPYPAMWRGSSLGDGRVAFEMVSRGGDACLAGTSLWDGARVVPLQDGGDTMFSTAAVGGVVFVAAQPSCQEAGRTDLTAYDLASGSSVVLAPEPAPTVDVPEWAIGLETWAVAGEHGGAHY
ncbi:hypothetical protein Cch01nite_14140 [Cellulomonas chitinilytica]|uniref:Uncharacterized protein n=1 Tax=Cellulomonas chitinilytica TaxID=398759 RepID=A0A919TYK2_9CELL|nr:hypothetical protein [Cellulomonas chitinilytica]GIG20690.1 hypothetical protein Cch01nite_14140 [Cellulomonas chitinilytica]